MLTACPKCQLLFMGPATTAAELLSVMPSPAHAQQSLEEAEVGSPSCCTPAAFNIRVSGWTGGSVVLQTAAGLQISTPEPSPSVPLSFVLPTTPTVILARPGEQWSFVVQQPPCCVSRLQTEIDLETLSATQAALRTSGWYYEGLSWQESASLLLNTSPGTFLVRDSSNPRYLFSLSVQTDRGPTSVRLHYSDGRFRLDAEAKLVPLMPLFDCVVKLVQYYMEQTSKTPPNKKTHRRRSLKDQVWIDSSGQVYSHILLTSPLRHRERFPSLMHLSRLAVNRLRSINGQVPIDGVLPVSLQKYVKDYPFTC